jgi:uncharacterized protein
MSYATAALATHANMLGTLDHLVTKAEGHQKGEALLQARLAEDMFPLSTQIRFICNMPGEALARLTGLDFVSSDTDPATFAEARERIAAAKALVAASDPAAWPAAGDPVEFTLPNGMTFAMQAHEYCRDWAMAQFYFHMTAAYAILRAEGLALGKADFVGYMFKYMKQPAA